MASILPGRAADARSRPRPADRWPHELRRDAVSPPAERVGRARSRRSRSAARTLEAFDRQARPAGQAPRLLRRRRPGRRGGRAGAGAARRRRCTCASRSCTTCTSCETLTERGAIFVDETDEVPEGALVVFSAHGVSPAVRDAGARARQLRTIDATCPLVTKVHQEAKRFAREDYDILLVGHHGPRGGRGHGGRGARRTSSWWRPRPTWPTVTVRDPEKVVWLSQTTLSVDETMETVRRAARAVPGAAEPAERRHLLRHAEPAGRGEGDGAAVRPRAGRRLEELVELGAAGRGGAVRPAPARRT